MTSSVPSDLNKLTVPQLKALCKGKRITGYSKLRKAALLQRLAELHPPPTSISLSKDQFQTNVYGASAAPSPSCVDKTQNSVVPRVQCPQAAPFPQPTSATTNHDVSQRTKQQKVSSIESLVVLDRSTGRLLSSEPLRSSQGQVLATSIQKTPAVTNAKRPALTETPAPQKRRKVSLKPTSSTNGPSVFRTTTLKQTSPLVSSSFRDPEFPPRSTATGPSRSLVPSSAITIKSRSGQKLSSRIPGSGRFKPLAASKPKHVASDATNSTVTQVPPSSVVALRGSLALSFDFPPVSAPELFHISYPPRASERKWVHQWAIVLSAISPEDRKTCSLVSRTFRYAGVNAH